MIFYSVEQTGLYLAQTSTHFQNYSEFFSDWRHIIKLAWLYRRCL